MGRNFDGTPKLKTSNRTKSVTGAQTVSQHARKSALSTFATKTYVKRSERIGTPLQGFLAEVSPHNFAHATSETLMASERKDDSDQDEDEDPWGLNRFEEEALAGLAALRSGIAPTPERIDRSPETEASREHHPDPPVIVSTPPHSPLRTGRSRRSRSVPRRVRS